MFFFIAVVAPNTYNSRDSSDLDSRLLYIDHVDNLKALKMYAANWVRIEASCTEATMTLYKIILFGYIIIAGMCGIILWKLRARIRVRGAPEIGLSGKQC